MNARTAFLALGSNLGDSRELLRAAMDQLAALSHEPMQRSSLWESQPMGCPPGSPLFVNAAVSFVPLPEESPETLLAKLKHMEKAFGRLPKQILNEPRRLDLDLIAFGNVRR